MVGIPGKSKGCNTCRRRKKGCDLQRPTCGQCQKANLQCGGYKRDTIWVNLTQENGTVRRHRQSDVTLAEPLARSASHELFLGQFWDSYLPNGRAFPEESSQYAGGVWMNELHGLFRGGQQPALNKVLLAISLTSLGQRDDKPWMVENGIKLYGSSLSTLAGQLTPTDGPVSDVLFPTSKLLSLYEILFGHDLQDRLSQVRNWQLHQDGELGFLASRGPESFTTGFAHRLFSDGRTTLISASIPTGSTSMLNKPDWRTIPWTKVPKNAKDLLGDIFAEIPTLVGDLNSLRAAVDEQSRGMQRDALVQKCWWLEQEWLKWAEENAPPKSPIALDSLHPTQVFDHLIAAQIMASYWAIGVFIYATLHIASGTWSPATVSETDPRVCCKRIIEIIPTFLNPHAGRYGVHGAIFPSIVSLMYLREVDCGFKSPEERALYAVFSGNRNGRLIRQFVDNMVQRFEAGGLRLFAPLS
ncbi:hypothetical protein ACJ41O_014369 [Fusarium nematophilum]